MGLRVPKLCQRPGAKHLLAVSSGDLQVQFPFYATPQVMLVHSTKEPLHGSHGTLAICDAILKEHRSVIETNG